LFGVLVIFRVPADPVGCLKLESIEKIRFPERVGSDNIDLLDFGRIAFVDCEI
jgi:hypothetical protein